MAKAQKGSYEDYLSGHFSDKEFHFRLIRRRPNAAMQREDGTPVTVIGSFRLEATSTINEKNEKNQVVQRVIRYIPGESSIYKDQQSDDKDFPKKKYFIQFVNGVKIVPGTDKLLVDFLMKSNLNASNPARRTSINGVSVTPKYELIDLDKFVGDQMKKDKIRSEVESFCWTADWDSVSPLASVLGVDMSAKPNEIRFALKNIAVRDPESFLSKMKDPVTKYKFAIMQAIDKGVFTVNGSNNSIAWTTNPSQPIHVAPVGRSVVDGLAQLMGTDAYYPVYKALLDSIIPSEPVIAAPYVPSAEEIASGKTAHVIPPVGIDIPESDSELRDMVDEAVKLGVVTFKVPHWFKYLDENGAKVDGLVEKLKTKPGLYKSFKYDLAKAQGRI